MELQTLLTKAQTKASELNPYLKVKCLELVELAYKNGYQIMIAQGYRSIAEQDELYAQGRTKAGNIVTNAKGGQSNHNYRLAFDIAILNSDGSIDWNTSSKYKAVGKLGQSLGLDWGGAWTSFVDLPHFEYTYGLTIKQLQSGVSIPDYPANYVKGDSQMATQIITANGITQERVYSSGGVISTVPLKVDGKINYGVSGTDVRYIKFNKDEYTMKLVWAKGKTVTQLVKENGADYGFNFPFFWDGVPVADCKIGNTVLNQGYDTPNGAQQTKWHGFAYRNGQPEIGMFSISESFGADGFMVKTTPLLINNGNPCWDWYRVQDGTASDIGKDASGYIRAQRTFVGLDAQGNLHLAVGDGRTLSDKGLTLEEMCLYMQSKGVITALNGDGGSSSVIADATGSLGQNKGLSERAVNHAILIYKKKVTPPTGGGSTVEQWKLDSLKALSQYKQANGEAMIDYDTWKDKLDTNVPVWLIVELMKRIIERG